jgi:hypothetical protein
MSKKSNKQKHLPGIPAKHAEIKRDANGHYLPGQSGNPYGRPRKGQTITDAIREAMDNDLDVKGAVVAKIINMAREGDIGAIKLLMSYLEGAPMQKIQSDQNVKLSAPLTDEQLSRILNK